MPEFDENTALRHILDGTAAETGGRFFDALVSNLASVFGIDYAWVTEYLPAEKKLRALAFFQDGDVIHDFEYSLAGTPCEPVIQGAEMVHHPTGVQSNYPGDGDLRQLGMESYLGIPLMDDDGGILGHMAIMDRKPMPRNAQGLDILKLFSTRATAELRRMQADKLIEEQEREQKRLRLELRQALETLSESESRYRDLFDQAPIAYVHEDLESRFIRANKTALRILGIPEEKAVGFLGRSLAPKSPEAQERVEDALGTINRGETALGKVLELRRYDDGESVWIRWWSSPDPSGTFTRTMFIDISD
ncbi:MAG: PAS domain S-box protein, partial [Rubricoccaceae bacterium]|nr:PAS domain S-box protein [Rubricoccaceae bacterium]